MNFIHWMQRIHRPTNRSVLHGFRLPFQVTTASYWASKAFTLPGCVAAGFSAGGLQPKRNRGGLGRESERVEFGNPPIGLGNDRSRRKSSRALFRSEMAQLGGIQSLADVHGDGEVAPIADTQGNSFFHGAEAIGAWP